MTTDTDRGVHALDTPCWTITLADGTPAGFEESEDHYESEAEAREAAPRYQPEGEPPVQVIQLGTCCWVADLICGERYVYQGPDADSAHFADENNVLTCIAEDNLYEVKQGVFACLDDRCESCKPYALPRRAQHIADKIVELGELALKFGRVERKTFHPNRIRPETDTDHTVMLGLVACGLAAEFFPELNTGLVAQFALTHDLPEVHAGDTATLRLPAAAVAADKEERERAATMRLHLDFHNTFPWVANTTRWYQLQDTPEAVFVWAVDKIMPKITHILNGCVSVLAEGMTAAELAVRYEKQIAQLRERAGQFPYLIDLYQILVGREIDAATEAGL